MNEDTPLSESPSPLWLAQDGVYGSAVCAYPGCRRKLQRLEVTRAGRVLYGWEHGPFDPGIPPHDPEPVHESEHRSVASCDFCSAPDPRWMLTARNIDIRSDETTYRAGVHWMACDQCRVDLDAGRVETTAARCTETLVRKYGLSREYRREVKADVRALHLRFIAARTHQDFEVDPITGRRKD